MAVRVSGFGVLRVAITLTVTIAAIAALWWLWRFYTLSPWTRDARVLANVVEVAPDVSGLISAIEVTDNQFMKKGDVLFVIDQRRFQLALEQAQASVAQSQAAARLAADDAQRDATAYATDPAAVAVQTVETSRSRSSEAQAALALAQAELATAQLNLERSTVRAPVNGYVTNLTATVGDYATAGSGVLAMVDSDSFYVYAYFMETKLPAVQVGDPAEVRLMAGGRVLDGTVQGVSRAIANTALSSGGLLSTVDPNFDWIRLAQRIPVRIALGPLPEGVTLSSGMSATVVVHPAPDKVK